MVAVDLAMSRIMWLTLQRNLDLIYLSRLRPSGLGEEAKTVHAEGLSRLR